jgi:hypothetical protein
VRRSSRHALSADEMGQGLGGCLIHVASSFGSWGRSGKAQRIPDRDYLSE